MYTPAYIFLWWRVRWVAERIARQLSYSASHGIDSPRVTRLEELHKRIVVFLEEHPKECTLEQVEAIDTETYEAQCQWYDMDYKLRKHLPKGK